MVLEAITPGTPHPVPINIGIKDLPERPNLRKIRSMINATRAIYPQASKNARKINNTNICGTNPSTAPTPATIPSKIRPFNQSAQPIASKPFSSNTGNPYSIICCIRFICFYYSLRLIHYSISQIYCFYYISFFILNFCRCMSIF